MENKWNDREAARFRSRYAEMWGEDLTLRTYTSRLLGSEPSLVLHGGGNTSVKGVYENVLGEKMPAIFVKASGHDLASIEPDGHPGLDLRYLERLRDLSALSEADMVREIRTHLLDYRSPTPSIETLVHAFLPKKFIDHTHADAVLALTNQHRGEKLVREALGEGIIVLDYVKPGFLLAKASMHAFESDPEARGMVWMHHGLVTWGDTARESYEAMIELVSRAEKYLSGKASNPLRVAQSIPIEAARKRWNEIGPILRGALAESTGEMDRPYRRRIVLPLINTPVLDFLESDRGRELALAPPLTTDHLIRTRAFSLWIDDSRGETRTALKEKIHTAVTEYRAAYENYVKRHGPPLDSNVESFDSAPRVVCIRGVGVACAGVDIFAARICRDITQHTIDIKARVASMGTYQGLDEDELFAMEYHSWQQAKLGRREGRFSGYVALVTGAAGAIGSGICEVLLEHGCHVAVTDLPGERLDNLTEDLKERFNDRVLPVPLDVTDPQSVSTGFSDVISNWGGVDLVVPNAGAALVTPLRSMAFEDFRRLEKVNLEGTLNILSEAARHFERQGTGGDIVFISTKNVFSPGRDFGAYSATKAGAHQLARIASLEMAEAGVRVNMVSPDAVFGEGERKSGLWSEVGPDRMKARGLSANELQEYYRKRNLLQARITPRHVGNAVAFFASRQTPTTGATLPVDGGLPDATPR